MSDDDDTRRVIRMHTTCACTHIKHAALTHVHNRGNDGSQASSTGSAWLKSHSWDSDKDIKLKQELKKMYHKGINAISKSIAKQVRCNG